MVKEEKHIWHIQTDIPVGPINFISDSDLERIVTKYPAFLEDDSFRRDHIPQYALYRDYLGYVASAATAVLLLPVGLCSGPLLPDLYIRPLGFMRYCFMSNERVKMPRENMQEYVRRVFFGQNYFCFDGNQLTLTSYNDSTFDRTTLQLHFSIETQKKEESENTIIYHQNVRFTHYGLCDKERHNKWLQQEREKGEEEYHKMLRTKKPLDELIQILIDNERPLFEFQLRERGYEFHFDE